VVRGDAPDQFVVDVRGIRTLVLQVKPVDGTRPVAANWADATFDVSGGPPVALDVPVEPREVLTPKPGPAPRINGPSLTGVTPGHDVLYKIPVTGTQPITYGVTNLPKGLTLDAATGIIRGVVAARGRYPVTFTAKNAAGSASKPFTFVAEGQLALTPAMGWNSWNAYGRAVSDSLARAAADAMVAKGLIDHGWTYVNLDDGWERSAREADPLYEEPVRVPIKTRIPAPREEASVSFSTSPIRTLTDTSLPSEMVHSEPVAPRSFAMRTTSAASCSRLSWLMRRCLRRSCDRP